MRAIFSTKDPIEALWNFKNKYPYEHLLDYLEYLDAHEAVQEAVKDAAKSRKEREDRNKSRV